MTAEPQTNRFLNGCAAFGVVALAIYVLVVGQSILQPIVLAIVIWFIVGSIAQAVQKLGVGVVPVPYGVALLVAIVVSGVALWLLYEIVFSNVQDIIFNANAYGLRLRELIREAYTLVGQEPPAGNPLNELINIIDLTPLLRDLASTIGSAAGDIGLTLVYLIFLFLEQGIFRRKMDAIARRSRRPMDVGQLLSEITEDVRKYVGIKTLTSLMTGVTSYAVLLVAGVDYAEFWAVIIFLLNYIPTVGSILGVVFPVIVAFLQGTDIVMPITVAIVLTLLQVFIGNWVEPRMMGRRLNLSPFVLIVSLAFWTVIWGVLGAFLCVPIMVILSIILSKFEETQWIAILLSGTGRMKETDYSEVMPRRKSQGRKSPDPKSEPETTMRDAAE